MQVAAAELLNDQTWTRVTSEVNTWRAACIQSFAKAEAAVTETLLLLSDVGERGREVRLRHLVGQRLEDLARALASDGGFASEGCAVLKVLSEFRAHEGLRSHLAHDVARIAIERNGTWVVIFRRLSIRSRSADRGTVIFEQPKAIEILQSLRRVTQQLDSALAKLRRDVAARCAAA